MAQRIEAFSGGTAHRGAYPWDEWMDGSIWRVFQQEDFPLTTIDGFRSTLAARARAQNKKVRTARIRLDKKEGIEFQFYPDPTQAS